MDHNELWSNLYTYKDPVSPKCSPYGPLTEQWSPGSPSYSSLHEESEGRDSADEEVLYHVLFVCNRGNTIQYHGGLKSRELCQTPLLQMFLTPRQALSSQLRQHMV